MPIKKSTIIKYMNFQYSKSYNKTQENSFTISSHMKDLNSSGTVCRWWTLLAKGEWVEGVWRRRHS